MRADTVRNMEQEIRVYMAGNQKIQEYERICKGYAYAVIRYQNRYHMALIEDLGHDDGWKRKCIKRDGYFYVHALETIRETLYVPACSNAAIKKAVVRACRDGVMRSIPEVFLYELEGEAIRSLSDTPVETLKDLYAYRQFLLMVGRAMYRIRISTDTSFPPGVSEMHNDHDDPAVIERVKNHLLEHGYLAGDASVTISISELVEI